MANSNSDTAHSRLGAMGIGCGEARQGDSEMVAFNLRDTLSAITVREANFSEFLNALRQRGWQTDKGSALA